MELFGLIFNAPIKFLLCTAYCVFLAKVVRRRERVRKFLYAASLLSLGLFSVELVLLARLGVVGTRASLGPAFYNAHFMFYLVGPVALANALVLSARSPLATRHYAAGAICMVFSIFQTLLHFSVADALYPGWFIRD